MISLPNGNKYMKHRLWLYVKSTISYVLCDINTVSTFIRYTHAHTDTCNNYRNAYMIIVIYTQTLHYTLKNKDILVLNVLMLLTSLIGSVGRVLVMSVKGHACECHSTLSCL